MNRLGLVVLLFVSMALVVPGSVVADSPGLYDSAESLTHTQPAGISAQTDADTSSENCGYPVNVTDATGETVTLDERPEDIVVLGPSAAQHMWSLGASDRVTGMPVNQYTAYLNGSDDREDVVDEAGQPVQERVVDLDPDLILAPNIVPEESVESLRDAGYPVYYSPLLVSVEDMYTEVERVGLLVGECEAATETVTETRSTVDEIETAVTDEEAPTVYYDLGFPWTAGEKTLENQLITKAGARNIALEANETGYFELSEEVIAANDPDWIIISEGSQIPDSPAVQQSTAVEEGQIIEVNSNYISQHGPRVVVPLERMATAFHPDAMEDVDAGVNGTDTATDSTAQESPADGSDGETVPADENGPGFVAGTVVVALCAVLVGVRYRR